LEAAYNQWEANRLARGDVETLRLRIGYAKGLSAEYTRTYGEVRIDLKRGTFTVDLRELPSGESFGVWWVDNVAAPGSSVLPEAFDHQIFVGEIVADTDGVASLSTTLPAPVSSGIELDRIVLSAAGERPNRGLLFASPTLFQRVFFGERVDQFTYGSLLPSLAADSRGWSRRELFSHLIEEGEELFFNETFGGNGRTCGTCHPTANNFTIDPAFIATVPAGDPLFVAETVPALVDLENPVLMRDFGLILENIDGFEDPTNKFVMRSVPHLLGLSQTISTDANLPPLAGTGWSGDGSPESGSLRDFAIGAVTQHFPLSLNRFVGIDFRLPTETELDDLEAFQLSLGRSRELEILSMTLLDPTAEAGRVTFTTTDSNNGAVEAGKCIVCHSNAGALAAETGFNDNFDTALETAPHPADGSGEERPIDAGFGTVENPVTGGFGDGTFNPPSLIEAADTGPFFHNNQSNDLLQAVSFYGSDEFAVSPAAIELQNLDTGGEPIAFQPDEITAFLAVVNTLENFRSVIEYCESGKLDPVFVGSSELADFALADLVDAGTVLLTTELHPEALQFLIFAFNALQNARVTVDQAQRNVFFDGAIMAVKAAQPLLVVPRVVFTSHADGELVSGTIELASEVLDVGVRGLIFQAEGETLCFLLEEPFVCSWDTTTVGNGVRTVTATTLDFQDNFSVGEIDLVVAN